MRKPRCRELRWIHLVFHSPQPYDDAKAKDAKIGILLDETALTIPQLTRVGEHFACEWQGLLAISATSILPQPYLAACIVCRN
jgi:hypothetical protein